MRSSRRPSAPQFGHCDDVELCPISNRMSKALFVEEHQLPSFSWLCRTSRARSRGHDKSLRSCSKSEQDGRHYCWQLACGHHSVPYACCSRRFQGIRLVHVRRLTPLQGRLLRELNNLLRFFLPFPLNAQLQSPSALHHLPIQRRADVLVLLAATAELTPARQRPFCVVALWRHHSAA